MLSSFISSFCVCLSLFRLFFGNIFKVESYFCCYDVSTSPFFLIKVSSYTFVLCSCIKIGYITFWSFSLHVFYVIKYILKTKNKDRNKKLPADCLSLSILLIVDSTHYFAQWICTSLFKHSCLMMQTTLLNG